jgi:hypothetical protein
VAEWFKAAVLKTARGFTLPRGFESHPFRQVLIRRRSQTFRNIHKSLHMKALLSLPVRARPPQSAI